MSINKKVNAYPATGILPDRAIRDLLHSGQITASQDIPPDQIQPASIDLRLGNVAYQVRASFLPGPQATVMDKIHQLDGYEIPLREGAVLEKGCVYVIPLLESLNMQEDNNLVGTANPKSSTGRLDVLTRLITDRSAAFDQVASGYKGQLYVEVAPRTFSIVVQTDTRLNQLRFRHGAQAETIHNNMLPVTIDLLGKEKNTLVGYRARKHTSRINVELIGHYDPLDFWEPLYSHREPRLILDPNEFYILMTREAVGIPPDHAAEMVAYDTTVGEFRVHYAGFFDPGFGWDRGKNAIGNSRAVLEVRSHEVPFLLEHGQTVGWLRYEPMLAVPDKIYGTGIGSHYQHQGLKLAKQFRDKPPQ